MPTVHRTSVTCGECLMVVATVVAIVVATVAAVVVQQVASVAVASAAVLAVADHSNHRTQTFL